MTILSIVTPLFFFLTTTTIATTTDLIDRTCNKTSKIDSNIDYTFCIDALRSTPSSHAANLTRLGLISINLAKKNVTATLTLINTLLEAPMKNVDNTTKQGLNDCNELYSDSVSTLSEAARDYRARRFDDANVKISSVMDSFTTCQQGFEDIEVVSPLTRKNDFVFKLCAIALSIMNMVS